MAPGNPPFLAPNYFHAPTVPCPALQLLWGRFVSLSLEKNPLFIEVVLGLGGRIAGIVLSESAFHRSSAAVTNRPGDCLDLGVDMFLEKLSLTYFEDR